MKVRLVGGKGDTATTGRAAQNRRIEQNIAAGVEIEKSQVGANWRDRGRCLSVSSGGIEHILCIADCLSVLRLYGKSTLTHATC